jgi:hypothetical protein
MSFRDHGALGMGLDQTYYKFVPHWYYGDKYESNPKHGGEFELKPTSF